MQASFAEAKGVLDASNTAKIRAMPVLSIKPLKEKQIIAEMIPMSGSVIPATILLGQLPSPRLRVTKAFAVDLERSGDAVVAKIRDLDEFGYGATSSDAL